MNRRNFIKKTAISSVGLILPEHDAQAFVPALILRTIVFSIIGLYTANRVLNYAEEYIKNHPELTERFSKKILDLMAEHNTCDVWVNEKSKNQYSLRGKNDSAFPVASSVYHYYKDPYSGEIFDKRWITNVSLQAFEEYDGGINYASDLPFTGVFEIETVNELHSTTEKTNKIIMADKRDVFI